MIRFGLLGHPVAHSLSPVMHEASFRALHLDAEYVTIDVAPESLGEGLLACRDEGFAGLNVTVPHKCAILPLMDALDVSAERMGAVNTVRFDEGGRMTGFNTDSFGFLSDLRAEAGITPMGKKVLVLGCGGAGRAIAVTCAGAGCSCLSLANRTEERARDVAAELAGLPIPVKVLPPEREGWIKAAREADLIVHCTTCGLKPGDESILPPEAFHAGQFVYDIVYTQPRTPILKAARSKGAWTVNGIGMLMRQGAASFRIWSGREANLSAMRMALDRALSDRQTI